MDTQLITDVCNKAMERAARENSSYKYWLCFHSCRLLFYNLLSDDNRFQVIFVPFTDKPYFGPHSWDNFVKDAEELLGEESHSITSAWIGEERKVS